jgi:type VI secretion system secreted protein Hcp
MKLDIPSFVPRLVKPLLTAISLLAATLTSDGVGYLKIEGVDGEAASQSHKNWCTVNSMSMGLSRKPGGQSSTGAPIVTVQEFKVEKPTDRSSPKLLEAVCKGKVFPSVVIELTSQVTGGGEEVHYRYELKNVLVTSYSVGGGADAPTEQLSLNYEEIKVVRVGTAGTAAGNVEFEWKVEEGES